MAFHRCLAIVLLCAGVTGLLTYTSPASANDTALELEQLAVKESDKEMYPQFDPDTLHYAVRSCGDEDTLNLMVSTKAEDTQLKIDGRRQSSNKDLELEIEHLDGHSDIVIRHSDISSVSVMAQVQAETILCIA